MNNITESQEYIIKNVLRLKEKIKERIQSGDYKILAEVLGVSYSSARAKYIRNNALAIQAMENIVERRERFTKDLKKWYQRPEVKVYHDHIIK